MRELRTGRTAVHIWNGRKTNGLDDESTFADYHDVKRTVVILPVANDSGCNLRAQSRQLQVSSTKIETRQQYQVTIPVRLA